MGQTSTSLPGCKVSFGGTSGCRGKLLHSQTTFWPPALEKVSTVCQALQTAQTLRKLQCLLCCQLGNLFRCISCQKTEDTFSGEGYFVSLLSKCRVRLWAKLCGVSLRTPHEGPISKGSTGTLLHFCLGWTPTLVPTIELWLVSPTHSSHFSWISVLPSVLLMQSHQEIQLLCGLEGP